jgi:exodeoxyribonuclease VII small subunit
MAKQKTDGLDDIPTFEQAIDKVRKIVTTLESGEATLGQSLECYEQGIAELKRCHAILDAAEQKVSVLAGFDADGQPVTQPLPEIEVRTGAGRKAVSGKAAEDLASPKTTSEAKKPAKRGPSFESSDVDDEGSLF